MRLFLALLLGLLALQSEAQYSGPAVDSCLAYAKRETGKPVVFDRDRDLTIERYTRKVGGQFVSSVLLGNGAVVMDGSAPAAELSFICLLADEKRPVFFYWLARRDPSAAAQCLRSDELRGKPRPCLEYLLQVAETDLTQVYALRFQEARAKDFDARNEDAIEAYRKSNDEWRRYRDAECLRKRGVAPAGMSADDYQLACSVDLTRRRALDMKER